MLKQPESRGLPFLIPKQPYFLLLLASLRFRHHVRSKSPIFTSREPRRFITLTYFSTFPDPFLSKVFAIAPFPALLSPTIAILCSLALLLPSYYRATFDPVSFPSRSPALFISPLFTFVLFSSLTDSSTLFTLILHLQGRKYIKNLIAFVRINIAKIWQLYNIDIRGRMRFSFDKFNYFLPSIKSNAAK